MPPVDRAALTAALVARQGLDRRRAWSPAAAVARLTPLQAQHPSAPYYALAARLDGFTVEALERAIVRRTVVKTTIMRATLHLVAASEFLAYAQLSRQARRRTLVKQHGADLDLERVEAELREWFAAAPRTNNEIREHMDARYGVSAEREWRAILFVRTMFALAQLPPSGFWNGPKEPRFVIADGDLPSPAAAARLVAERYFAAFGPASAKDLSIWAGVPQSDFAGALDGLKVLRGDDGRELLDLPRAPRPRRIDMPVRYLGRWEQLLLAYHERSRIIPDELTPLQLALSGDQTVTVDGRVAASWKARRTAKVCELAVTLHRELSRQQLADVREEGLAVATWTAPQARASVALTAGG